MPLPFIVWAAGVAIAGAGAVGVAKTASAYSDSKEAEATNRRARRIADRAKSEAENARSSCGNAITRLGETKVEVLNGNMARFIDSFEKLKNVDFTNSSGLRELSKFRLDSASFKELKSLRLTAASLAEGASGGVAAGAITAFGAYSAAGAFAAASTGTAIASLSGAAATNATLAFFGGGALAAGGLGIAGGTLVLGGLVAAPALAVFGCVMGKKAEEALERAQENESRAEAFAEEMKTIVSVCDSIESRADMMRDYFCKLDRLFAPAVTALENVIRSRGVDYRCYGENEKNAVTAAASLASAIKAMLDTPLLTEDGKLTEESSLTCSKVRALLN